MRDAILLVAHGSRRESGQGEMFELRDLVAARLATHTVDLGYLELSQPPAGDTLDDLVDRGASRVVIAPLMLHAAGHSKSDVPAIVVEGRMRHPTVDISYARPFGVDHALVDLARRRIEHAGGRGAPLALASRGTSDPEANGDAWKVARMVADMTDARTFGVGFSGVTWPTIPDVLEQLRRLGASTITAFAWFLATGVLVERMQAELAAFSEATGVEVIDAGYLGPCGEVADLVVARVREAARGRVAMSCDACSYRVAYPGQQDRVGQPVGVGHSHLASEHRHRVCDPPPGPPAHHEPAPLAGPAGGRGRRDGGGSPPGAPGV